MDRWMDQSDHLFDCHVHAIPFTAETATVVESKSNKFSASQLDVRKSNKEDIVKYLLLSGEECM